MEGRAKKDEGAQTIIASKNRASRAAPNPYPKVSPDLLAELGAEYECQPGMPELHRLLPRGHHFVCEIHMQEASAHQDDGFDSDDSQPDAAIESTTKHDRLDTGEDIWIDADSTPILKDSEPLG